MASLTSRHRILLDGIAYSVLLNSPPPGIPQKGETILLIHALMSNSHMYDHTVSTLTQAGYTTIRVDLVGHGETPPPPENGGEGVRLHLDDVKNHMHRIVEEALGMGKGQKLKAVIGCSVGGLLALRYAMLFPEGVEKVVAVTTPGMAAQKAGNELWARRVEQFRADVRDGTQELAEGTVRRWFPARSTLDTDGKDEDEDEAVRREALEQVKTCTFEGYRIMADAIRDYDYEEDVRGIQTNRVDVLVVAGSEDVSVPPKVLKDLAAEIPGARYVCMEGAGHLPPMHRAEEFEEIVVPFLGG